MATKRSKSKVAPVVTSDSLRALMYAAKNHAVDAGEADHEVGDLQDLLRRAWTFLTPGQRVALLNSPEVKAVLEAGGRGKLTVKKLIKLEENELETLERAVAAAGYTITEAEDPGFFCWMTDDETSDDFYDRGEAVRDAYKHYQANQ